jgi:hypothetical protein
VNGKSGVGAKLKRVTNMTTVIHHWLIYINKMHEIGMGKTKIKDRLHAASSTWPMVIIVWQALAAMLHYAFYAWPMMKPPPILAKQLHGHHLYLMKAISGSK